jgi:hypothetical protein
MEAVAEKSLVGLTEQDLDFIAKARALTKNLNREVYRCLCILSEMDAAFDCLSEDDEKTINELRENWARWHAKDLQPEPKNNLEIKT